MAINFPNSPNTNDTFTVGDVTYTYDGTAWKSSISTVIGPTGPTGPSTIINATNDTSTTTLYPVMVGAAGSNETPKVRTTSIPLSYDASTGTLVAEAMGINTVTPGYALEVNGSFAATTKSFVINHPTKPGMKLRYGSLEGPENGVYVRGRLTNNYIINLPSYWTELVDENSITVQLTAIGSGQQLFVDNIVDNKVFVKNGNVLNKSIDCFYLVQAERKDVERLEVEY